MLVTNPLAPRSWSRDLVRSVSRGWRIVLSVVAVLVVANLALRFLGTLTGGTPGGPRSSSYATSSHGTGFSSQSAPISSSKKRPSARAVLRPLRRSQARRHQAAPAASTIPPSGLDPLAAATA